MCNTGFDGYDQKIHQAREWCLDGAYITQLDLDRAGDADPHDSPVVGKAKCSCPRGAFIPAVIQMIATPVIAAVTTLSPGAMNQPDMMPMRPDITASVPGGEMEPDTNRPGDDYASFDLAVPDPQACADACREDEKCTAFTYVKPGIQGEQARCWLKSGIPDAHPDACCVSGVIKSP